MLRTSFTVQLYCTYFACVGTGYVKGPLVGTSASYFALIFVLTLHEVLHRWRPVTGSFVCSYFACLCTVYVKGILVGTGVSLIVIHFVLIFVLTLYEVFALPMVLTDYGSTG